MSQDVFWFILCEIASQMIVTFQKWSSRIAKKKIPKMDLKSHLQSFWAKEKDHLPTQDFQGLFAVVSFKIFS